MTPETEQKPKNKVIEKRKRDEKNEKKEDTCHLTELKS